MSYQLFDRGFFYKDGALIGDSYGGGIEYQGDPIIVATLPKDFAGVYPVPKHAVITVDQYVAVSGKGLEVVKAWLNTTKVTAKMQLGGSGLTMEAEGVIMAPGVTTSATDPTKLTFKIAVEAKEFK